MKKVIQTKFIPAFVEMIAALPNFIDAMLCYESFHYRELRMMGYDPDKIYKGMRNLRQKKYIRGNISRSFTFTKNGITWFRSAYLRHMRDLHPSWDKKWRVVIFDIPQEMHNERNCFRARLKTLGFYMLQKSIFVFPYPCEEELGYICDYLKLDSYVDVIIAQSLGAKEQSAKDVFNL